MPVRSTATHDAGVDQVLGVLTDEGFLRELYRALGAEVTGLEVARDTDGVVTTATVRASTAGIPAVFARFVAGAVTVVDRRSWRPVAGGHRCELDVGATLMGREVALRGHTDLTAVGASTTTDTLVEATVDAPLVGRQAEGAVRELAGILLRRQNEALDRRLAQRR